MSTNGVAGSGHEACAAFSNISPNRFSFGDRDRNVKCEIPRSPCTMSPLSYPVGAQRPMIFLTERSPAVDSHKPHESMDIVDANVGVRGSGAAGMRSAEAGDLRIER